MKKALILLKYNCYSNRKIKKEASLNDYLNYDNFIVTKIDFNFNDFITTTQTINFYDETGTPIDYKEYNYLLVVDGEENENGDFIMSSEINSRWYITKSYYKNQSQLVLVLKRDSVVDYYDTLINSNIFIQKGYVGDNNPLSLIREPINLNKIKKGEYLLKDKTKSAWVVGYFTNNIQGKDNIESFFTPPPYVTLDYISRITDININDLQSMTRNNERIFYIDSHFITIKYTLKDGGNTDTISFKINNASLGTTEANTESLQGSGALSSVFLQSASYPNSYDLATYNYEDKRVIGFHFGSYFVIYQKEIKNNIINNDNISQVTYYTDTTLNRLKEFNEEVVRIDDDYYFLYVDEREETILRTISGDGLNSAYERGCQSISIIGQHYSNISNTRIKSKVKKTTIRLEKLNFDLYKLSRFPALNYRRLNNKPYSMFCMPLHKILIHGNTDFITDNYFAMAITKALIDKFNVGYNNAGIYDIQILPYCPLINNTIDDGIDITKDLQEGYDYTFITRNNNRVGIIFYCVSDDFMISINNPIENRDDLTQKEKANLISYRLVSPNYQGAFDFNLGDNGGTIDYFNVLCTYKPYTPSIKIAPNFKNLYGAEYSDNRGCICAGDFSITQLTNAWTTYELNNKNYQNIFNRDIQNLEFTQGQEKTIAGWNIASGVLSGVTSGAIGGGVAGGVGGAIGGGIAGAIGSSIGGIVDYTLMSDRHKEQLDYALDKYNLNLGNIKAMPNTLTKVSSFDILSKIFPFVEYYNCTDKEEEMFKNKMQFEGYTLGVVDIMSNYVYEEEHYLKGRLIRIDDEIQTQIFNDIDNELNKGIYIRR